MRVIKFLISIIAVVVIVSAIVGYLAVRSFDLNKYKSYISEIAEKELGRRLVINGNATIGISLIPTIEVADVELANPSWAKNKQMVMVKNLELKFALLPLLKKQIVIDKILLDEPQVYLEVAKDGRESWDFNATPSTIATTASRSTPKERSEKVIPEQVKENPALGLLAGFAAKNVIIRNGLVVYDDEKSKSQQTLQINKIILKASSITDDMNLNFDVVYNKQVINGEVFMGSLKSLIEGKDTYPLTINASALGIDFDLQGSVENLLKSPRYAFQTNVYNPAGNLNAPETTLTANVDGNENAATIAIQSLNVVNNQMSGEVKVNWAGKIPVIRANLKSPKLNLQNFSQNSNFAEKFPDIISSAQASMLVPDTTIPYADLQDLDLTLSLRVTQLILTPAIVAQNVVMDANLQKGVLNVKPLRLGFGGGDVDAELLVNANNQNVQLKMNSKNMDLQNLHKEFVVENSRDFGVLSGGNVDLSINVNSQGATYRQLVQAMNGQVIAIVGKSVVQTGNLNFMTGNFLSQLLATINIANKKDTKVDLGCAVVRADLSGGKAIFPKGIAISSKQLTLVSDGNINLVNDKINFSIQPFSGKVVDTNVAQALSSFVKVKGTLEDPRITLDDKEAIKALVGVVTTGGASYLGSKLLLDGNNDPCYTALKGTAFANRFPAPTGVQAVTQEVYQDANKKVEDDVKALKNAAKNFLKSLKNM